MGGGASFLKCVAFSCVSLLLLAGHHADQIVQQDDNWEEDDLGVEMVPEKSYKPRCSLEDCRTRDNLHSQADVEQRLRHLIEMHQTQVEHLEHLVDLLGHNVEKLIPKEDAFAEKKKSELESMERTQEAANRMEPYEANQKDSFQVDPSQSTQMGSAVGSARELGNVGFESFGSVRIVRYKPVWSDYFQFLSAVKIEGEVTCLHVLPHDGEEGLSRYVAVGDNTGRVYIFLSHGDVLVDFATPSSSPISAMLSFPRRRNETLFVTGHSDGTVLMHRIWESVYNIPPFGDDLFSLSMEFVQELASSASSPVKEVKGDLESSSRIRAAGNPITNLEVYRVGQIQYILVADAEGKIQVFRENGKFYGVAESPSRPIAFLRSPNTQRLLFLTETGAASLDLRSMTVRSGPCEGLNGSSVVAYAFDAAGRSKAYGFTRAGEIIYVALSGDTLHFECHVRTKKKLEVQEALTLHGIKGYLLVATQSHVSVYNTTLQLGLAYVNIRVGDPRPLFRASMDDIALPFVTTPIAKSRKPVMACNREKLVVLGFGDGYVGIYKSNLPVHKPSNFDSKLWGSPLFLSIATLIGAWLFFGRKRGAPAWMSDFPVSSSSTAVPGVTRSGLADARDSLRESRRLNSSSRTFNPSASSYSGGNLKYRPSTVDPSFLASTAEPNFRAQTVDPSFRASAVETSSYPMHRESLLPTAQPD